MVQSGEISIRVASIIAPRPVDRPRAATGTRGAAAAGSADDIFYAEWSAASDDITDEKNWIAANPPKHTSDVAGVHYQTVSKLGYRVCSSFTHGHAWPIHLLGNPMESFGMMADSINLALINTECALSLYEAQSTDPNGSRTNYYPERLQVTIDDWRTRY